MQDETTYSLLVWDNIDNLPFPDEVKPIIKSVNWSEFEWNVAGLPLSGAKYSVVGGKTLYLSELPDGTSKVLQLSEFTGNIYVASLFLDNDVEGDNFFVNFLVTILKGEVVEVKLLNVKRQPVKEYNEYIQKFNQELRRVGKIARSFWFKWLYRPWFIVVRGLATCMLHVLYGIRCVVVKITELLTPL